MSRRSACIETSILYRVGIPFVGDTCVVITVSSVIAIDGTCLRIACIFLETVAFPCLFPIVVHGSGMAVLH